MLGMKHLWELQALLLLQPCEGNNCRASVEQGLLGSVEAAVHQRSVLIGIWPTGSSLCLHLPLEVSVFLLSVPVPAEAEASRDFGCLRGIFPTKAGKLETLNPPEL